MPRGEAPLQQVHDKEAEWEATADDGGHARRQHKRLVSADGDRVSERDQQGLLLKRLGTLPPRGAGSQHSQKGIVFAGRSQSCFTCVEGGAST